MSKNYKTKGKNVKGTNRKFSGDRKYDNPSRSSAHAAGSDAGYNDPNWYATDPQLLKDAASLSFFNAVGLPKDTASFGTWDNSKWAVPGICRIDYVPTFGISSDGASAINVVARNYDAFVRKNNSGRINYNAPDLMITTMAVDQAYVFWAYMVRIYGLAQLYKTTNRYYPRTIIESMGLDYDELLDNLADFRYYINLFGRRLSQLTMPADMKYMKRALWCVSHVWRDSNDYKAQLYYMHPIKFWVLDETSSEEGGFLHAIANNATNLSELKEIGERIILPLVESDDIALMCGDIRKAYGDSSVLTVASIPSDFMIDTEYSQEVLSQFQNMTCWMSMEDVPDIVQDPATNAIIFDPILDSEAAPLHSRPTSLILNLRDREPTPENVMVATRLMSIPYRKDGDPGGTYRFRSCGTEIITGIIYDGATDYWRTRTMMYLSPSDASHNATIAKQLATISQFDYHPTYYLVTNEGIDQTFENFVVDIDNYTFVSEEDLNRMHECAIFSLLVSGTGQI